MMKAKPFPHYTQLDSMDCGPTCLRMIAKHYGRSYNQQNLREKCFITREGVSMLGISDAAESIGMHTQGVKVTLEQLMDNLPLPCILHWNQRHFVALYKIRKKRGLRVKPAMTGELNGLLRSARKDGNSQLSTLNSTSPTQPVKNT